MPGIAFSDWVDSDKAVTMGHLELIKEKELYDPILRFEYRHICLAVSSNQPAVAKWLSRDFEFNSDHVQTAIVNDYLELTQLLEYWADERFIEIAVRCKSYKVGNWLIAKYHPKRSILIRAAICGFAEAIRQLGDDEEALSEVLDETAQYNIVKYIGRKKPHLLHSRNLEYAVVEGRFSTVRYLYNFGIRTDKPALLNTMGHPANNPRFGANGVQMKLEWQLNGTKGRSFTNTFHGWSILLSIFLRLGGIN
jgi:hypothetical protein